MPDVDGFVGLDPELCRSLARDVVACGETAGHIAVEVRNVLAAAELGDAVVSVDVPGWCDELESELGLLGDLLRCKADEMEMAAAGITMDAGSTWAYERLWASLTDEVGEGIELYGDWRTDLGGIPMSGSVAASELAAYLAWRGPDASVDGQRLQDLADDATVPIEVRAAAQFFLNNPSVMPSLFGSGAQVTARHLEAFVATNSALAALAPIFLAVDTAHQGDPADADGRVSIDDLHAVVVDRTGQFTRAQRDAAAWLLSQADIGFNPWETRHDLTAALLHRQIFAEDPDLAVAYLRGAAADPAAFVDQDDWLDQAGTRSWLNTVASSSADPADQADLVVTFASVYMATRPPEYGPIDVVHDVLDTASFVDPTQLADIANTSIYAAEGDFHNAALSAAGVFLLVGGGKVLRFTDTAVFRMIGHRSQGFETDIVTALAKGDITPGDLRTLVDDLAGHLDDDTLRQLSQHFDELVRQAEATKIGRDLIPDAIRLENDEFATVGRLVDQPRFANRTFRECADEGAEFVDEFGRRYDVMGAARVRQHWNIGKFEASIDDHLIRSNDFTVVDLTEFAPHQIDEVRSYLDSLTSGQRARIIRVGF